MFKKVFTSPVLSLLSVTFILSICNIEVEDARLLMIPQSRDFNHNSISLDEDMEKVIPYEIIGLLTQ